jgi:acyl-CoA synthetase (AMP-forming)/AMP-acid ligase II/thioesterase domain-containing protein/acyl carrier protein
MNEASIPEDMLAPLRQTAAQSPHRIALLSPGRTDTSYAALLHAIDAAHHRLHELGVTAQARVASVLPNAPETAILLLALCTHATAIPLNPDEAAASLRALLHACQASHLIVPDNAPPYLLEAAREAQITVLAISSRSDAPAGAFCLSVLQKASPRPQPRTGAALVLHTSGSTSNPKRVPLSAQNLCSSAWNVARSLALGPTDLCLNMMPMFHIGALVDLLLAPLYAGGAVVFAPAISAAAFLATARRYRPSWFQAVPTLMREILNAPDTDPGVFAAMRFIRVVSQPLPERLRQDFEARFSVSLVPIYGMTETAGVIASAPLDAGARKPGSVGPSAGPQVRIADAAGASLPPHAVGEVQVRGPSVMAGYEDAPAQGAFRDGWLLTGDMGYLDRDGFLFLTGRIKDIINRGGEKIAPAELDLILLDHPGIHEAAAFAVSHPSLGEEVGVAVASAPGCRPDEAEVIAFLRARVAPHKLPRRVLFLDRLPRLPSGKLDRRGLAAQAEDAFRGRQGFVAPQSELARRIAALWCKVLRLPQVGMEDDFFDLGGDSLTATTLAQQLEAEFGLAQAVDLFETPTVRAMERLLAGAQAARQAVVAGPAGVISRNKDGWKTPFFWVLRGVRHFDALAGCFDSNRPLHGFGVFLTERLRDNARTWELARQYADEVEARQPHGPLLLGGFCQEGLTAFRMAQILRGRGRQIGLLVLQDRVPPEPYDGRVALLWSRRSRHTLYYSHVRPERGLATLLQGPVAQWGSDADHIELYHQPHVALLARQLDEAIAAAETASDVFAPLPPRRPLDPARLRAGIRAKVPRLLRQGEIFRLAVSVTNKSTAAWGATPQSGIVLAARWHVFDDEYTLQLDGHAELDQPLAAGQTQVFDLDLRLPMRGLPMRLEIDLVEDGLRWFGAGVRRLVLPLAPR